MKFIILSFFCFCSMIAIAQKAVEHDKLPFVFAAGAGIGKSPIFEDEALGIAGMLEFGFWKKKTQAILSYHSTGEFDLLGGSSPSTKSTSLDIHYGRVLLDRKIKINSNVGIGVVRSIVPGQYLYSDPGLFGRSYHEKLKFYTLGLPISTKILLIGDNKSGLGFEVYVNVNKDYTFYMLTFIIVAKNK